LGGKKLLVLRGQSDAEEGILAAQAGEDSGICWDEAEEGYGLGITGWRAPVDYPQVLDRPVVICPRLFDW
jgi:hypothetical protein